jgi:hypothetical protein
MRVQGDGVGLNVMVDGQGKARPWFAERRRTVAIGR